MITQRAVDRDVILGQQPLPVLDERGLVKRLVFENDVLESLEQQVEAQLLAELTLRADHVEGHQQARLV